MRLTRSVLKNPFDKHEIVVFVAECEKCGYAAVAANERAAADIVEKHKCSADGGKEEEGAA